MGKFNDYYKALSVEDKSALASKLDTSPAYLYQISTGRRSAGAKFLLGIKSATNGTINAHDLRPDMPQPPQAA